MLVVEVVGLLREGVLQHVVAGVFFGERDVYSFLEPSAHGRVEAPGVVGGSEDEDLAFLVADALHLHEELGLDSPAGLVFVVRAGRDERVYLVDEDDGRLREPGVPRFPARGRRAA